MSDEHSGLSHDLPEYVPNWPVPVKVKARVYKYPNGSGYWGWAHNCPKRAGFSLGYPQGSQPAAFEAAMKHVQGCW